MTIAAELDRIRVFLAETKMAPATLAKRAGLSPNALRGVRREDWSLRTDTLGKVQEAIEQIERERAAA